MPGTGITSISARFAAALPYGAQIASSAEVWSGENKLLTLQIEASSTVKIDRNNLSRTTCSVVLTDPNAGTPDAIVPQTAQDILTPYGNELVIYQGLTFGDGTQELIQLGVFGLDDVDIDDGSHDLVITLIGSDRSVACQHAGFTDIYTIPPGTNVGVAIQALIASLQTGLTILFSFSSTSAVTPTTPIVYKPGDDPWSMASQLASAIGYELFFTAAGVCTLTPIPDPTTAPISWSYDEGSINIATHIRRRISRTLAPNYIIRDGQGSGIAAPVRGIAQDTNPLSATWVGGPYGLQVNYSSSSLYADQPTAQAAADADLLLALGTIESIEVQAIPKPDTHPDDVIEITRMRSGLASKKYVIDSLTIGFGHGGLLDFVARQVPS